MSRTHHRKMHACLRCCLRQPHMMNTCKRSFLSSSIFHRMGLKSGSNAIPAATHVCIAAGTRLEQSLRNNTHRAGIHCRVCRACLPRGKRGQVDATLLIDNDNGRSD